MKLHRIGRERRGHRENDHRRKDPHCLCAARHGLVLHIALKTLSRTFCAPDATLT
jgi:hypothetical protein